MDPDLLETAWNSITDNEEEDHAYTLEEVDEDDTTDT